MQGRLAVLYIWVINRSKGGKVDGRGRENLALEMKLFNADKSCVGDGRRIERWKVGI